MRNQSLAPPFESARASAACTSAALDLEHIQIRTGDGSLRAALGDPATVHIRDVEREERWPVYVKTAVTGGSDPFSCGSGHGAKQVLPG